MNFKDFFLYGIAIFILAILYFGVYAAIDMQAMKNKYNNPTLPKNPDGIIVLGGHGNSTCAPRIDAMVNLMLTYPKAKWIFTGGSKGYNFSIEAKTLQAKMIDKNIPINKLIVEDKSLNTKENAIYSYNLIKPKKNEIWILVTSYYHINRAIWSFNKAGWNNYFVKYGVDSTCNQNTHYLEQITYNTQKYLHEVIGSLYYKVSW